MRTTRAYDVEWNDLFALCRSRERDAQAEVTLRLLASGVSAGSHCTVLQGKNRTSPMYAFVAVCDDSGKAKTEPGNGAYWRVWASEDKLEDSGPASLGRR